MKRVSSPHVAFLAATVLFVAVTACAPAVERASRITTSAAVIDLERLPTLDIYPEALVPDPTGAPRILYTARTAQNGMRTYIYELVSGERVLVHEGPVGGADWTPDGLGIVYSYWRDGSSTTLPDRMAYYDTETGSVRDITPFSRRQYGVPSVSPDGRRVAVTTSSGDAGTALLAAFLGESVEVTIATIIFPIDGGGFETVPDVVIGSPNAFHPREEKLVGVASFSTARQMIVEIDLAANERRALTSGLWALRNPGYSPTGEFVAYSARYDDLSHVYAIDTYSGDLHQLTKGNTQNTNPAWGADDYIYFLSDVGSSGAVNIQPWRLRTPLQ